MQKDQRCCMPQGKCHTECSAKCVSALSKLLADTYFLYLKTQNYHWNVTGENFACLHNLFEVQYNEMFAAIDVIAERIRVLKQRAPGSFAEFQKISTIKENIEVISATQMIDDLRNDHCVIILFIQEILLASTANYCDEGTKSLFTERLVAHEKMRWMLDSSVA